MLALLGKIWVFCSALRTVPKQPSLALPVPRQDSSANASCCATSDDLLATFCGGFCGKPTKFALQMAVDVPDSARQAKVARRIRIFFPGLLAERRG